MADDDNEDDDIDSTKIELSYSPLSNLTNVQQATISTQSKINCWVKGCTISKKIYYITYKRLSLDR